MAHSFLSLGPRHAVNPSGAAVVRVAFLFRTAPGRQTSAASIINIVAANPTDQMIERPGDQPST